MLELDKNVREPDKNAFESEQNTFELDQNAFELDKNALKVGKNAFELDKNAFGEFLAAQRKKKGYTQKDLADRLFISDKAVSKWERGLSMPDISLLMPLSQLLDVSVAELLSLIFGIYFWFFSKERLPAYYDENPIHIYSDGFFRIHMIGVNFNNSN